jgi:hypothetical protein
MELSAAIELVRKVSDSHYGLSESLREAMRIVAKKAGEHEHQQDEIGKFHIVSATKRG